MNGTTMKTMKTMKIAKVLCSPSLAECEALAMLMRVFGYSGLFCH